MPATERMSRVDTAWLRMDTDANLMMIVGVWLLEPTLKVDEVRERFAQTLLKYPRFKQRVTEDAMGANWVEDDDFDLEHHVVAESLSVREGVTPLESLKARVADLAAEPLTPQRPLWQMHLVEDMGDGRSALISRIHHCIGDGIALISVMLSIADGGKPPPARKRRGAATRAESESEGEGADEDAPESEIDWLADAVLKPMTDVTIKAIGLYGSGVAKGMEMLANPQSLGTTVGAARAGAQMVSDLAAFAMMSDDSPTVLKGKAQPGKRVAWGEPLPLDAVKLTGKVLGVSINDVLLSCVAGAIGAYLRDRGDDPAGKEIRAMVPVNLRPLDQAHKLGNRFGLVPLVLPIGIEHPVQRVYAVHARMNELKGSYQPLLAFAVLAVAGLLIKPAQAALLGMFAKKATAVMTNVPGPKEPLRFCGRTVEQVMFWVPQSGDIGMGVSILSYGGGVQFGLITDPEAIIARFAPEFDKLLLLALMAPWDS
jgi:diacylglycerol O-acyltransferase / wax synthase